MELTDLLGALVEHNATNNGYQIQLNSSNLKDSTHKSTDVEFGDLYFTSLKVLRNDTLLCFDNMNRKPIDHKPDGTNLYPMEINSQMFLEINQIECIEEVQDKNDWFNYPSSKVFNIYMLPNNENLNGHRNVITVGLMH